MSFIQKIISSGIFSKLLKMASSSGTPSTISLLDGMSDEALRKTKPSKISRNINSLDQRDLKNMLKDRSLNEGGVKQVLQKRLKSYFFHRRDKALGKLLVPEIRFDYFVIIDFEATCLKDTPRSYQHEIIEFPAILVDGSTGVTISEFHRYCKPVVNPILSEFCTDLTGITQELVDKSDNFVTVLRKFECWLDHSIDHETKTYALVTDGPFDFSFFFYNQCKLSEVDFPAWAKNWVNLKKTFCNYYGLKNVKKTIPDMLSHLGLTFEGDQHCGLHDARNIARIVTQLLEDHCILKENEVLDVLNLKEPNKDRNSTQEKRNCEEHVA